MLYTDNFREISRKEKFYGITVRSWIVCGSIGFTIFIFLVLWGFLAFGVMVLIAKFLEWVDDDIFDIFFAKINISGNKFYA